MHETADWSGAFSGKNIVETRLLFRFQILPPKSYLEVIALKGSGMLANLSLIQNQSE